MSNWQLSEDKKWHYARYTMQLCDALREDPTLLDGFTFNDPTLDAPFKAVFTAYFYSYEIGGETIEEFKDFITNKFKVNKGYYEELMEAYKTKINMLDGRVEEISREFDQNQTNSGSDSNTQSDMHYDLPRTAQAGDKPSTKDTGNQSTTYGKKVNIKTNVDKVTTKGGINVIDLKKGYMDMLRDIQQEFCRKEFMVCFITMYN